ncbi:MAG: 2-hydroxyacid dehydrogenase [Rhizobiaceae bacterium]
MSGKKPVVIVTRKLPDSIETRMRELFSTRLNLEDTPYTEEQLVEAVQKADVLVPTVTDRIDEALIKKAGSQLKLIASFGNGVDNIDVAAAAEKGIAVTNTPNVLSEDTADMTIGLLIAVSRRFVEGAQAINKGRWVGWSPTWMLGDRIWGKRLGIIGMGRIGTAVARRAKAFGLSIHYHNRNPVADQTEEELEATFWENLEQMLPRVDFVSVNCPSTPATYHLLSEDRLAMLQKGAIIINTARGEIIDEAALTAAITQGRLGGAGLDVFEHEPAVDSELMSLVKKGKVVLLPHMGSATKEGRMEMGERVLINIRTWADRHRPPDRVLPNQE